ncbi:RNA polymerase II transcription factor B subunit 1 [Rhizopus stolonifer]|uniref:RNA polymerase II transcription factor B subunit 1 n=1 Tax=Rhizopus stolonifer TaxID=4846 RepID=A0A367KWR4_RHIST|nr:RNA polymerase II transcription factor B subunit 1 [Rhizopus stolonifer]
MWEPNEQLLLRAPVRFKKQEGTLFVTPKRVAYQQQGSSQLTPSIYYNNIAGLAQTPESSPKVLLKISLKNAAAKDYTFQFTSAKNIQEREGIKSQIAELLARARGLSAANTPVTPATPLSAVTSTPSPTPITQHNSAISSPLNAVKSPLPSNGSSVPGSPRNARQEEFNDRRSLLTSSRELQTLHKELVVVGKSVDEEDFWASPYVKRIRQKLKKDAVSREGKQKGKSSRMVELKPGQQEGTDIKYTLTSQVIHSIFTEFPSVKRAYDTNVPDKMTEQVFWKRFLASEFFHRSRTGGRSQLAPYDDIFDRCLQEEDEGRKCVDFVTPENSKPPTMSRLEKIRFGIDLSSTQEDHIEGGNAPDFTMKPGREAQTLPLIRRFNRHSMRVLETTLNKPAVETPYMQQIEKEIIIQDLVDEKPSEKIVLDIQDTRRYFESQTRGSDEVNISKEYTEELLRGYKRKFEDWQPNMTKQIMSPGAADAVCADLTSTIKKKVKKGHNASTDTKLPNSVQQKIQSYHSATNEILRHFWSSYEPYKPDKNNRMIEGLRRQQEKLKEILISVVSYDGDPERCKQTLAPLMTAVNKALETSKRRLQKKR